jgi:hypothetical protein
MTMTMTMMIVMTVTMMMIVTMMMTKKETALPFFSIAFNQFEI